MSSQPAPAPFKQPGTPAPVPVPVKPPTEPRRPRRRWWLAGVAAAIGLGGLLWLGLRSDTATKTGSGDVVVQPSPSAGQTVPARLRLSGQTAARHFAQITVPQFRGPDSGRDLSLEKCAKPGSFVKQGEIVAEFEKQNVIDHIDDVKDTVEQAENDVLKKQAEHKVQTVSLEQSLKVAKADWDKALLDVRAAEVKTDIEREIYRLAADEAEAAYKELQREVAQRKTAQDAELQILKLTVARHKIHLDNHMIDLDRFTIRAPMAGLVVMAQTFRGGEMRQVQEGDQVFPGMQIMKIVDVTSMQVEAKVSQTDSSQYRVGQPAVIGLDAFPGLQFRGKIRSIGAIATKGMWDTYYIRNVPVNIAIEGSDPRLIPDLSAWALVDEPPTQQTSAAKTGTTLASTAPPKR